MKTQIKKLGDTVVVIMDGRLDFDTYVPLREDLSRLIPQNRKNSAPNKSDSTPMKIIFNMENLEFVGSSGISSFVQTLKEFNQAAPSKPRYCNVRSEFKRVFKAFDETLDGFDFYDSEDRARKSFDQ